MIHFLLGQRCGVGSGIDVVVALAAVVKKLCGLHVGESLLECGDMTAV